MAISPADFHIPGYVTFVRRDGLDIQWRKMDDDMKNLFEDELRIDRHHRHMTHWMSVIVVFLILLLGATGVTLILLWV